MTLTPPSWIPETAASLMRQSTERSALEPRHEVAAPKRHRKRRRKVGRPKGRHKRHKVRQKQEPNGAVMDAIEEKVIQMRHRRKRP